ncbi:MAG TPA: hypothetical protein DCR94_01290 [Firmicutes bacterium]|nr:hypothetical protein [Bacillota bacterium]
MNELKTRIGIVGASSGGLFLSLLLSNRTDLEIIVFDKNEKPARKLNATGNGHCNILPGQLNAACFNNAAYMGVLIDKYPLDKLVSILSDLGIRLFKKSNLYYPLSFSSNALSSYLINKCVDNGIKFQLGEEVLDYEKKDDGVLLKSDKKTYIFDKLIFSTGGKSQKNFGSDGSLFPLFKSKGYKISPLRPSLCPIKIKEKVKSLSGKRHLAKVTIHINGKEQYSEQGEILFKDDGLSGIAIFNCSFFLNESNIKNSLIKIDLFPWMSLEELSNCFSSIFNCNKAYNFGSILEKEIANYLLALLKSYNKQINAKNMAFLCKNLIFHPISLYGFENSQVTRGGLSIENFNENLESKIEKNVHFIGEMIDIDGMCGGNNLAWCLLSSLLVFDSI